MESLNYVGRGVATSVDTLRTVAQRVEMVADRVTQRAKRSYRFSEEEDVVRADRVDMDGKSLLNMRAPTLLATAKALLKMDAKQIHVG